MNKPKIAQQIAADKVAAPKRRRRSLPEWWPLSREYDQASAPPHRRALARICPNLLTVAERLYWGDVERALVDLQVIAWMIRDERARLRTGRHPAQVIDLAPYLQVRAGGDRV